MAVRAGDNNLSGICIQWLRHGDRSADPLLQIRSLDVRVAIRQVLSNLDLEVYRGDHVRITGPNGSGKSTLLNAIAGVEPGRIVQGRIFFRGLDIGQLPAHERACAGITYMRQTDNVFEGLSVKENICLALGKNGPSLFQSRFPKWAGEFTMTKAVGCLSGGQKKKLAWAMTILKENNILLLLDEPQVGVSDKDEVMTLIASGDTILFVEHGDD